MAVLAFGLFLRLLNLLRGDEGIIVEVGTSGFMAATLFFLIFELAPRGKPVVAGVFLVLIIVVFGVVGFVIGGLRGLGIAGVIPIPPPPGERWTRHDTTELLQSLTWTVVSIASFRYRLQKHRETKAAATAPSRFPPSSPAPR